MQTPEEAKLELDNRANLEHDMESLINEDIKKLKEKILKQRLRMKEKEKTRQLIFDVYLEQMRSRIIEKRNAIYRAYNTQFKCLGEWMKDTTSSHRLDVEKDLKLAAEKNTRLSIEEQSVIKSIETESEAHRKSADKLKQDLDLLEKEYNQLNSQVKETREQLNKLRGETFDSTTGKYYQVLVEERLRALDHQQMSRDYSKEQGDGTYNEGLRR